MSFLISKLRHFDAYSKPLEDFRIKTLTGGTVTLASATIMALLFLSELRSYLRTEIEETLFVDTSSGDERVNINFDVLFPALPCPFISVDAMDISGEHQSDVSHTVWKKRLGKNGETLSDSPDKLEIGRSTPGKQDEDNNSTTFDMSCGSCYGAETALRKCCDTCDDVRKAYADRGWAIHNTDKIVQCQAESWAKKWREFEGEGCQVYGTIGVAKVGGNFHIAPGKTVSEKHAHVHDLHSLGPEKFNTTHKIIHFSFGATYPGKSFPLDDHTSLDGRGGSMAQYYVKIVPTAYEYVDTKGVLIMTHQFSVTKHQKVVEAGIGDGVPGMFVLYEFSPLMVKLTEVKRSFAHFLTSLCAIIGGVFTVASLIDSILYHSGRVLQQKIELGKAS